MESKCRKYWQAGIPCPPSQPSSVLAEASGLATSLNEQGNPRSIAFGVEPQARDNPGRIVPIPGYDAPSLPLKPLRDPALSLIALSGVDPSGPVMVEVPLVENNTAFTATHALGGRRVGFAERFVDDHEEGRIEHPPSFLKALDILRQAGTWYQCLHTGPITPFTPATKSMSWCVHSDWMPWYPTAVAAPSTARAGVATRGLARRSRMARRCGSTAHVGRKIGCRRWYRGIKTCAV